MVGVGCGSFKIQLNMLRVFFLFFFFFFNDTATTEIYTLSLHDALPIFHQTMDEVELGLPILNTKLPVSIAGALELIIKVAEAGIPEHRLDDLRGGSLVDLAVPTVAQQQIGRAHV